MKEDDKITIVNKIFEYDRNVQFLLATGKNLQTMTAQSERKEAFGPIFEIQNTSRGSIMFQDLAKKSNNSPMFFQALVKIAFKVCFSEFCQCFLEGNMSSDIDL